MAGVQRRGGYTPKRAREQRAYRLVQVGGAASAVAIIGIILDVVGIIGATLPIIAIIVAVICVFMFRSVTRSPR
jgi:hypothetical protein